MKFNPSKSDLLFIYDELSRAHGPSEWWPSQFGGDFEIICGAILTQNTAWQNVERALSLMRERALWSWQKILSADDETLQQAIRPAGYYRIKAKKLKIFAAFMRDEFDYRTAAFAEIDTDTLRAKLLSVWGIGPETADDIVLYVAERASFVIDKYTMRLTDRLGWLVEPPTYDGHKALFERLLPPDAGLMQEYHGLIDLHCARVCRVRPKCEVCVLSKVCQYPHKSML